MPQRAGWQLLRPKKTYTTNYERNRHAQTETHPGHCATSSLSALRSTIKMPANPINPEQLFFSGGLQAERAPTMPERCSWFEDGEAWTTQ